MTKINNNNLEALKAYYGKLNAKQAAKEDKQETNQVEKFSPKQVEASALDLTAAQIWGAQLSKVDTSDAATERRLEQAFTNSSFMAALDDLQGIEEDFPAFAMANIKGCDFDKLAKYLHQPLSDETAAGVGVLMNTLIA